MSNDVKSIHEFDLNLIVEYFANLERQGPGSPDITLKALSFIENLNKESKIADIGCGSGGQTMVLGKALQSEIIGIDLFPRFIDLFNQNALKAGIDHRVKGQVASMDDLPFEDEFYDLIWSEGAIYNVGFERGLNEWNRYIKKGGYIAVSEASWFTDERPDEIEQFWMREYDQIDTIPNKVLQMQKAGYVPVATFILPDRCWIDDFYQPQHLINEDFLAANSANEMAHEFIRNQQHEEQLYHRYKAFYGYVFYIGKKL